MKTTTSLPFNWRAIVLRLIMLAIVGGITWGAITTEATPVLLFLAGAGSGWAASWLFAQIRDWKELVAWLEADSGSAQAYLAPLKSAIGWVFFSPGTAALVVAIIGCFISGLASFALTLLSGAPISEAWAGLIAFAGSQVLYFMNHPDPAPQKPTDPPVVTVTPIDV